MLCLPSIHDDPEGGVSGEETVSGNDSGDSSLEDAGVVPCPSSDVLHAPGESTCVSVPSSEPGGRSLSLGPGGFDSAHGVENFGRRWRVPGLSDQAT